MPKLVNNFLLVNKKAKNNGFCGEKYRSNDTSAMIEQTLILPHKSLDCQDNFLRPHQMVYFDRLALDEKTRMATKNVNDDRVIPQIDSN